MCLIILREQGVILDKDKFKIAVENNSDGWGLSLPDGDGQLLTLKSMASDWEELYDLLHTDYKDDKVLLHLRFSTAGDTILRNAHPFPVLERGPDGVDMRMAHNGTIHKFKPALHGKNKWESDTRVFTREFVRPLFKRLIRGSTSEDLLTDPFVDRLLQDQITSGSVLVFLDGHGNSSIVNESGNGGFRDENNTYFSNKYSFNETHRKPYTVGKSQGVPMNPGKTTSGTPVITPQASSFEDCDVEKFSDLYKLTHREDLYLLSDETLQELVLEEPDDAVLLLKELLAIACSLDKKLEGATKALAQKTTQIKALEGKLEENKGDKKNGKAA